MYTKEDDIRGRRCDEKPVTQVSITQSLTDGYVTAYKEGYEPKHFMDVYFDWLLYTGYVKKEIN